MEVIILLLLPVGFVLYLRWAQNTKDAPYVPMNVDVVERVMRIAKIGPGDVFYDLGSGDGRLVIAAALHGAKAYGVELDKLRAFYSNFWIKLLRLSKNAKVINDNLFNVDLSKATVVNTYLLPETHEKLKQKLIKELKKGTKVTAVGFEYKDWKKVKIDPRGTIYGPIYLYLM